LRPWWDMGFSGLPLACACSVRASALSPDMHSVQILVGFRSVAGHSRFFNGRVDTSHASSSMRFRQSFDHRSVHPPDHHPTHPWELLNEHDRPPALCPPRLHLYGSRRRCLLQRTLPQAGGIADVQRAQRLPMRPPGVRRRAGRGREDETITLSWHQRWS
jgi:hypothetical protein